MSDWASIPTAAVIGKVRSEGAQIVGFSRAFVLVVGRGTEGEGECMRESETDTVCL